MVKVQKRSRNNNEIISTSSSSSSSSPASSSTSPPTSSRRRRSNIINGGNTTMIISSSTPRPKTTTATTTVGRGVLIVSLVCTMVIMVSNNKPPSSFLADKAYGDDVDRSIRGRSTSSSSSSSNTVHRKTDTAATDTTATAAGTAYATPISTTATATGASTTTSSPATSAASNSRVVVDDDDDDDNVETVNTRNSSGRNRDAVGNIDGDIGGNGTGHYTMFFGRKMCHPGFAPPDCIERLHPANPWYTMDCRNLSPEHADNTLWPLGEPIDEDGGRLANLSMTDLGGRYGCVPELNSGEEPWVCAYLCYSHKEYGVAVVPQTVWRIAQEAEGALWTMVDAGRNHDRAPEHVVGFNQYDALVGRSLGHMIEVGAGPWTQSRFLLDAVPPTTESSVSSLTVYEPSAEYYINNVPGCAYKSRTSLLSADRTRHHTFPLEIIGSVGGESLLEHTKTYDTLVSMNVIEHVQNAYKFLEGLHRVIKPGGLLVFHERYYDEPMDGDCVLGVNFFHPIRITKKVLDVFLFDQFDTVYVSTDQTPRMKRNKSNNKNCEENPIYFIGIKK